MTLARRWFAPGLAALTLIGGALRWMSPGREGLWRDEAQYLAIVALPSPAAVYRFLAEHESHPPLYYWLGQLLAPLDGSAEVAMGALSLLASVAAIPLAGILAALLFGTGAGLAAAAMVALSAPVAFFSVQIRPYAVLSLLWMVSSAAFIGLHREPRRGFAVAWVAASVLALWIHHTTLVLLAAQGVMAVVAASRAGSRDLVRRLAVPAGVIALLWIPLIPLFRAQLGATSYPSVTPMDALTPWRQLGGLMLQYPLELFLPVLAALLLAVGSRRLAGSSNAAFAVGATLAFLATAALATYRSQLLVPHLLIAFAPVGMIAAAGAAAGLFESGRRGAAALLVEAAVVLAALGLIFMGGVRKSNTAEVARTLRASAGSSDLVVVSPGYLGVSFNRFYDGGQSQIDYPTIGRESRYSFRRHFERLADTAALRATTDSIDAALAGGRAVWFLAPGNWLRPGVSAPVVVRPDSFGGLSQGERSRTNFLHRYLVSHAGPPRWVAGDSGQGMEVLTLMHFGARGR